MRITGLFFTHEHRYSRSPGSRRCHHHGDHRRADGRHPPILCLAALVVIAVYRLIERRRLTAALRIIGVPRRTEAAAVTAEVSGDWVPFTPPSRSPGRHWPARAYPPHCGRRRTAHRSRLRRHPAQNQQRRPPARVTPRSRNDITLCQPLRDQVPYASVGGHQFGVQPCQWLVERCGPSPTTSRLGEASPSHLTLIRPGRAHPWVLRGCSDVEEPGPDGLD